MLRLLHLSDLHFGPPYLPKIGEAFLQLASQLRPDAIVVSGDLTQRARRDQFIAARGFLDQLPDCPTLVVPGNHDVPLYRLKERWFDPHGLYKEIITSELNPVLRLDQAVLVGIDSTSPRHSITNGRIGLKQLDHCQRVFTSVPAGVAKFVVAHHHFAPAPDYLHDQTMPRSRRAINQFVELGVEMILGGHLHRSYIGNSLNFYPGNHRDRGIVIVQCGTTTSRRGRGPESEKNSFNVIEFDDYLFTITHYTYFEEDKQFSPLSRHQFPRLGKRLPPS